MISQLVKELPLTLTRDSGGNWDTSGKWVLGATAPIDIAASIQPFRNSNVQVILPEGITANDTLVVYTKSLVKVADQFNNTLADTTLIDGFTYVAFFVEDWARHTSMNLIHYKVIFVRQDKLTNGGL